MRVVVALGGNALMQRGAPMTAQNQRANVAMACTALAPIALEHELVISHGNGPQVGLLALQAAAYDDASAYPFDVLGAQTEGMIGYIIEQELGNRLPFDRSIATILTMTEVDPRAISIAHPDALAEMDFAAGSMGPKVEAAIEFALGTGNDAVIGSLADLPELLAGTAGSRVSMAAEGVAYHALATAVVQDEIVSVWPTG